MNLILNDRLDRPEDAAAIDDVKRKYKTKNGIEIEVDLTLWCIGEKINNGEKKNNFFFVFCFFLTTLSRSLERKR